MAEMVMDQDPMQFIQGTPNVEDALEYAINAIDQGETKLGSAALMWIIKREPKNRLAWIWMACTVTEEKAKRECYINASA